MKASIEYKMAHVPDGITLRVSLETAEDLRRFLQENDVGENSPLFLQVYRPLLDAVTQAGNEKGQI